MPTSTDSSNASSEHAIAAAERVLAGLLTETAGAAVDLSEAVGEARLVASAVGPADAPRTALAVMLSETLVAQAVAGEALPAGGEAVRAVTSALAADAPDPDAGAPDPDAGAPEAPDPRALAIDTGARAFAHPRLRRLPSALALAATLELLAALAPADHVALAPAPADDLVSVPVSDCTEAVLVARPRPGERAVCEVLLRSAAAALRPLLDALDQLLRERPAAELLADASERRAARIGFDLHDGAIQTLAALIADTRLLEAQLSPILGSDNPVLAGRIDDLKARMVVLEFELRSLCQSLESPVVLRRPFERVVEQEIVSFKRATGIALDAEVSGNFDGLTPSQRITLLRVVQEALRNVGEHSDARSATLRITTGPNGSEAVITDDGQGFDVEAALARAVADGRVGLLGMMERARLLGGRGEITSCEGGPTTVAVHLPPWNG